MTEPAGEVEHPRSNKHFEIKVLSASNLAFPKSIIRGKRKSFYVEVHSDAESIVQYIEPGSKDSVLITVCSVISRVRLNVVDEGLRLFSPRKRGCKSEDILGFVERTIEEFLGSQKQGLKNLNLEPIGQIEVEITEKLAETSLEDIRCLSKDDIFDLASDDGSVLDSLTLVVEVLKKLGDLAQFVAAGNPYIQTIVSVLSFFYKPMEAEIEMDKKIRQLAGQMKRLYFFVSTLEGQDALSDELKVVIKAILKQTVESAYFIREYMGQCFAKRTGKNILSKEDHDKINDFLDAFAVLGQSLDRGILGQSVHVSLRMETSLAAIQDDIEISRSLVPISYHAWESRPRCQEGTCKQTIDFIVKWVSDMSGSRVLWLHGLAGTGKSTIATTIADFYSQQNRLGAFIYFNRKEEEKSRPEGVIRTLAYNLSVFDRRIRQEVLKAIRANFNVSKMPPKVQFSNLISQPLNAVEGSLIREGPIVIVIDALDECIGGEADTRHEFFDALDNNTASLPDTVRIIITTRSSRPRSEDPETETTHITPYKLERSYADVEQYLRRCLNGEPFSKRLAEKDLETLVQLADGLFIWAAIALRYILGEKKKTLFPERNLRKLVTDPAVVKDLNGLYATALEAADSWSEEDCDSICAVLGLIMFAKTPLLPDIIDSLLGEEDYTRRIVEGLESVLDQKPEGPVTIPHITFSEYLLTCRGKPWYIEKKKHKNSLVNLCLSTLRRSLGCVELSISSKAPTRSPEAEAVAYSCRFWVTHVLEMEIPGPEFEKILLDFLSKYVLRWFEAMSILRASYDCAGLLEQLLAYVEKQILSSTHSSSTLWRLIHDSARFATFFSETIANHPTSVYSCAIPFIPTESQMYKLFHVGSLPTVFGGYQRQWSRSLRVWRQLDKSVQCLAVSPDGRKLLATGDCKSPSIISNDTTVSSRLDISTVSPQLRLWDISTSLEVIPVVALDDFSMAEFSLDGTKIWCASRKGTLQEINAKTGEINWKLEWKDWSVSGSDQSDRDPEEGFKKRETNLGERPGHIKTSSFDFSPALAGLLSRDDKKQGDHQILDPKMREVVFGRMAFSVKRQMVILGAEDGRLYIVDLERKKQILPTIIGPSFPNPLPRVIRFFHSIVFDETGTRFAVASHKGEIELRDARSGLICTTFPGHASPVIALRFTTEKLISSAVDGSICTWDLNSGATLTSVQSGIADYQPLGIDPSGGLVVSTTANGTIYIWDVQTGEKVGMLQGPCNAVSAVAFSNDSARIVSGAFQNDIQIWDISSFDKTPVIQRHDRPVHRVQVSADGFCVRSWRLYKDQKVKFWDVITGKELQMETYDSRALFTSEGSDIYVTEEEKDVKEEKVTKKADGDDSDDKTRRIPLLIMEGNCTKLWSKPTEGNWVKLIELSVARAGKKIVDGTNKHKPIDSSWVVILMKEVDDKLEEIWRIPSELGRCRSVIAKGNVLTFGMWDGRVFSVYFPDELLGDDSKTVKLLYGAEVNT